MTIKNGSMTLIALAGLAIFFLVLGACRNDAITYARMLDTTAECREVETKGVNSDGDSAICRTRTGHSWFCFAVKGMSACLDGDRVVRSDQEKP